MESIEFLIETPGEDIPHLNIRPHFKHRGVAKKFEGLAPEDGVLVAERVEGIASVAHALAFSHALEAISGAVPPPRARFIRVIHAELERVANHLDVAVRLADAAGLAVATSRFAWHKESVMRLISRLSGSRFGRNVVVPGGVAGELRISPTDALTELAPIARHVREDAEMLMRTPSFLDRLRGTGRLDAAYARDWALIGPLGRASSGTEDTRWTHPMDAYAELVLPDEPAREDDGDVLARTRLRFAEITTSLRLIGRALEALPSIPDQRLATPLDLPDGDAFGLGWAEAPQGEALHAVSLHDGRITRCFARSASLHNLHAFRDAFHSDIFTDFAFIEASFGLSYAGVAM
jgi:Ni,Fe-hydrogenase III large subunit